MSPLPAIPCLLLVAPLLVADAVGQSSAWAELAVPQGVVSNAVKGQGKLVTYDEGSALQVFSAVTRQWQPISKSPAAAVTLFNDCVVIIEPGSCRAFSSHTATTAFIATPAGGTLLNPPGNKNDSILLVQSGQLLHAFSAFTGEWTTHETTGAASATTQRHVAVLQDGPVISAMSAFEGRWHDFTHNTTITDIGADGTVATVSGATLNFAFSAHTCRWQVAPALGNATLYRGDDWALWLANGATLAYSGLRGAFVSDTSGASGVAGSTDLYALLTTPAGLRAFSAVTGDLISITSNPTAIDLGAAAAVLHEGATVIGYSPLRQETAALSIPAAASGAGTNVAYVTDAAGRSFAWSSITASWHQAPAATNGAIPALTTTSIGLMSPTDAFAFAATTGEFVPHGGPLTALASNPTSAPLLGYDATHYVAFDSDAGRWMGSPRASSTPPIFSIWRTSSLVIDDLTAHGFGAQAAQWHRQTLAAANGTPTANSEVAYVVTPHHIAACSMLPEIVSLQQFPHFRRVQPRGAPIGFAAAPVDGALAIAAFAPLAAPVTVPGLGTLSLDGLQATLVTVVPTAKQPVVPVTLQLPADPILSGSLLTSQMVVLPFAGQPYLSDRATVSIW